MENLNDETCNPLDNLPLHECFVPNNNADNDAQVIITLNSCTLFRSKYKTKKFK